jgi:hypothetical protein
MCRNCEERLTFERLFADPLTHMMMASDGVTEAELRMLLEETGAARRLWPPPVRGELRPSA